MGMWLVLQRRIIMGPEGRTQSMVIAGGRDIIGHLHVSNAAFGGQSYLSTSYLNFLSGSPFVVA